MADNEPDPGGDTEMFRAFVDRAENYQPKPASKGPIVAAAAAVGVALILFLIIIALG